MAKDKNSLVEKADPGFAAAEYNSVALGAKLEGINLLTSHFFVEPSSLSSQKEWKLQYGRRVLSSFFSSEENSAAAIFQYYVVAKLGRKKVMECSADYGVFYEIPAGSDEEGAKGFCRNVGTFAAYPYFRALCSHLFAEARISLPPLPSIASTAHIPPKKAKEKSLAD